MRNANTFNNVKRIIRYKSLLSLALSSKGGEGIPARIAFLAITLALAPSNALACAACYGASDSLMAKGFNWGIISLLAVVVVVLGSIASFFIYLARRASAFQTPASAELTDSKGQAPVPVPSH